MKEIRLKMLKLFLVEVIIYHIVISTTQYECSYRSPSNICPGTAVSRIDTIQSLVKALDMNKKWENVRKDLVSSCGLLSDIRATSHCFNDWNHVDCCSIRTQHAMNTNEHSKIDGMHRINYLGDHIIKYSIELNNDKNGSWCTCHMNVPNDVCHKQFGAINAFKLIWCPDDPYLVTPYVRDNSVKFMAVIIDNDGNVLNHGYPIIQKNEKPSQMTMIHNYVSLMKTENGVFKNDIENICSEVWNKYKNEL